MAGEGVRVIAITIKVDESKFAHPGLLGLHLVFLTYPSAINENILTSYQR
jgi:hypothetical protein